MIYITGDTDGNFNHIERYSFWNHKTKIYSSVSTDN